MEPLPARVDLGIKPLMKALLLSSLVFVGALAQFSGSAVAQPSATPLTDRELNLLISAAALTSCGLIVNKVNYDMSVSNSAGTVVRMINDFNGGNIPGFSKPLTTQQAFQAVSTEVALRTLKICPKALSEDTIKQLNAVVEQRKSASANPK